MPAISCPTCQATNKLPANFKAPNVKCQNCGIRFAFRKKRPPTSSDSANLGRVTAKGITPKQLDQLFSKFEPIPRPPVTLSHRIVALMVMVTMLILPLLYVGFICLVAYGTWWHATHNYIWMKIPLIRLQALAFLLYGSILIGGVVWVFSLLRPFFVRVQMDANAEGLSRKEEPALYAFCDRLADYVGSPRPDHIQLELTVNASASYTTKLFGLKKDKFILSLGIPLIAGTTVPQLAGIMAHEFGHFSQTGSTLLDRIIRRVNLWFAIAIFDSNDENDFGFDDEEESGLYQFFVFISWMMVGMGKIVLWLLMHVGIFVSSALMRRMEFDADRYEIATVGTKTFTETSKRLILLNIAYAIAGQHVFSSMRGDHLPDDLPAFTTELANKSKMVNKRANQYFKQEKPGFFASHPTTRERIRAAEKINAPGHLHTKLPATALFDNFRLKSKNVTRQLYEIRYGPTYTPETSRSTREAIQTYLNTMEN